MIFNLCLTGNINHNFLVPRMIESAPKTFMPIQTLDLDRVQRKQRTSVLGKLLGSWFLFSMKTFHENKLLQKQFNIIEK